MPMSDGKTTSIDLTFIDEIFEIYYQKWKQKMKQRTTKNKNKN